MASLYFHIPFCKRLCGYCDFYRSVKLKYIADVTEKMHAELHAERDFLHDKTIRTIYFGGGTPSLLSPSEIERFISQAREEFDCSQVEEITIEVNPDDITPDYVAALRQTSVNRISMGVQSLNDDVLKFMGRRHSAQQAVEAVKMLQGADYDNISVDLIFGVEGYGADVLQQTLEGFLAMGVQHISAYHLTIEENTRFGRMLSRGEMNEVAEERSEAEFLQVHNVLTEAGFDHYEVSNYALKGYRSKHNSSYWRDVEYLGLGPGAHSYNGEVRRWSEQSVGEYCVKREYESEKLSEIDHRNEYIMTSLRCADGVDVEYFKTRFGAEALHQVMSVAKRWLESGDLCLEQGWLKIPARRFLISDAIIESLFEV